MLRMPVQKCTHKIWQLKMESPEYIYTFSMHMLLSDSEVPLFSVLIFCIDNVQNELQKIVGNSVYRYAAQTQLISQAVSRRLSTDGDLKYLLTTIIIIDQHNLMDSSFYGLKT